MPRASLKLPYQPPYHWPRLLEFLTPRLVAGLEEIVDGRYRRHGDGWSVTVTHHDGYLAADLAGAPPADTPQRLAHLFDLDAPIADITLHLAQFPALRSPSHPGLRLPGCWDPFELIVRAILGQQVSVKGAATLCARLVDRFGPPTPAALADADITGLPQARAACLRAVARAFLDGLTIDQLHTVKGIGPWTVQYVRMRALHDRDAFPSSDLVLLKKSGHSHPRSLTQAAEPWRPFRAYAAMYLWRLDS